MGVLACELRLSLWSASALRPWPVRKDSPSAIPHQAPGAGWRLWRKARVRNQAARRSVMFMSEFSRCSARYAAHLRVPGLAQFRYSSLMMRGDLMFHNCEKLRETNRHVVESRQRVLEQEARAAELARKGDRTEEATSLLEEFRVTLRYMERHREFILQDHARGS